MDNGQEGGASPSYPLPAEGPDIEQAEMGGFVDPGPAEQLTVTPLEEAAGIQPPSSGGGAGNGSYHPQEHRPEEMAAYPAVHSSAAVSVEPEAHQPLSTGLQVTQHPEMLVAERQHAPGDTQPLPAAQPLAQHEMGSMDADKPAAREAVAQMAPTESVQDVQSIQSSGAPAVDVEPHALQQSIGVAAGQSATEPVQQAKPEQHDDRAAGGNSVSMPQPHEGPQQAQEGARMPSVGSAEAQADTSAPAAPKPAAVSSSFS